MYRCSVCTIPSKPGAPQRRFVVYRIVRGRREVAREIPVCSTCLADLEAGHSVQSLQHAHNRPVEVAPAPLPPQPTPITYRPVTLTGRILSKMRQKQSPV
jgi:hypothetical protein